MSPVNTENQDVPAATGKGKSRIIALDLMRGYFILLIASIHLAYYPSLFGAFDGRGQLWVSEAEGFFLISGLLIGIIRRSDVRKVGYKYAVKRMWQRGAKLYVASIALTLLYQAIAAIANGMHISGFKGGLDFDTSVPGLLFRIITLQYSYGWADFLGYYALFMFMAPLVVGLLTRRLWWMVLVLSFAAWTARWAGDYGAFNPFLQWQVYFFMGSVIGYYWHELTAWVSNLRIGFRSALSKISMATSAAIMALSTFAVFTPLAYASRPLPEGEWGKLVSGLTAATTNSLYDSLLLHGRIGLLRPLVTVIVFAGLFAFVLRFEAQILRFAGKVLLPFGQNSLYVYIIQSALLFAVPFFVLPGNFWVNSSIEIGIIALALLAVRKRFLFNIIPR
jgi:hypothetical protein